MIMIIKNISSEGTGTIEDFLRGVNMPYRVVEDEESSVSLEGVEALVVLGGPMGVYEMSLYPRLREVSLLIEKAIGMGLKVLGICLGAQLTAHVLGARVYKGHSPEIGWLDIELTPEGVGDPLMRALAVHPGAGDFWRRFKVFQWHGDTFDIPIGAVRLASSTIYENQAFRFKDRVYALQFHIEVNGEMLSEWFSNDPQRDIILKEAQRLKDEYEGRAFNFYRKFFFTGEVKEHTK